MLSEIRDRAQGWIAKVILGLIILTFAAFGIESYLSDRSSDVEVAQVGEQVITQQDFQLALRNQKDARENKGGAPVNTDDPAFRQAVIDDVITSRAMVAAAEKSGIQADPQRALASLGEIPLFQEDGKFSAQRLDSWLRNRGMTQTQLIALLQQDVQLGQLEVGLREGSVLADGSVKLLAAALSEQREVNEQVFDARRFLQPEAVDAAAIKAEYAAQQAQFATAAQAKVEYVVFSLDQIKQKITVDDAVVQAYYKANLSRFSAPEERRARHILILARADQPAEERAKARAQAEKVLAEVKAKPADFAAAARKYSQDPGSAASGGDLGFFTRERMVKAFSDAAFGMQTGEISGVVESEFGYHLIQLVSVRSAQARPFERLKPQLTQEWLQQEAQKRFAEQADRFANQVYEQANGFAAVAKAFNLKVESSDWISKDNAPPALLHPNLLAAIFAPESVSKRQNTDAVEIAPNTLVAARVLDYKPAGVLPLETVSAQIRLQLAVKVAMAAARKAGTEALQAVQTGAGENGHWSANMTLSRMQPLGLPPEAVRAIFKQSAQRLPVVIGVETRDGYRLYRLNQVVAGQEAAQPVARIKADLRRLVAQSEVRAFVEAAKADLGVKVDRKALGLPAAQ